MEDREIVLGILKVPFRKGRMLYCLEPTKSFTFGCAYRGMFLSRERGSNWLRECGHTPDVFVCEDDNGHIKYMRANRFAKKLS